MSKKNKKEPKKKSKKGVAKAPTDPDDQDPRNRSPKLFFKVAAGLAAFSIAVLSGALEPFVPLAPYIDKATWFTADIKIESVYSRFGALGPRAFENLTAAEAAAQKSQNLSTSPGAIEVGSDGSIRVDLKGNRYQEVRIKDIRITDLEQLPIVSEALICPPGGGGSTGGPYEVLDFQLDGRDPVGMQVDPDGTVTSKPYFLTGRPVLAKNESIGFLLLTHTQEHHVRFKVKIDYVYGSTHTGSLIIDNDGRAFEYTAFSGSRLSGPVASGAGLRKLAYRNVWLPDADESGVVKAAAGSVTGRCN
jgi:hypothetical protein